MDTVWKGRAYPGSEYWYKFKYLMVNSEDPDLLASEEVTRCGSTLFAKAGHIRPQDVDTNSNI